MRAIVTGAARGLGFATAKRLYRDGADVVLVDRDPRVESAAGDLAGAGRAVPIEADVSDQQSCREALDAALDRLEGLDLLVNCAGIGGPTTRAVDMDLAAVRTVLDVNLFGAYALSAAAIRVMAGQGTGGVIVNVTSILEFRAEAGGSAYCVSKAALGMLTRVLALEGAPAGIRVNAVAPGNMETDMHFDHLRDLAEQRRTTFEQERRRVVASIPLGRHGTGDDIAGAVTWLASADASYVTGQTIVVDGGVLL